MKRFLGTKKDKPPAPTLDDVGTSLDKRGTVMDDKIKALDAQLADIKKKMNATKSAAVKTGLKKKAMQLLKQRKMYEKNREHLYGQQFNIDQTKFAAESAKDSATMVAAMKVASKDLKKAYKEVKIEDVENLHDEMTDLLEMGDEVNEILGQSYGVPEDVDEDELLGELDALDDELELGDAESVPSYLVSAKEKKPVAAEPAEEETDELGLPKVPVAERL